MRVFIAMVLVGVMAACGNKGPLFLPEKPIAEPIVEAVDETTDEEPKKTVPSS